MGAAAPAIPWPWGATSQAMKDKVASARVLAVGAGGIGCELLKTLVLSGFRDIEVIDLDTIEVSNLNRQFLFRKQHVGHSKAKVAAAAARRLRPGVAVTPHLGNVKEPTYGVDFFRGFDLVLNGLDNLDARRHVNLMALVAGVPLVESGTAGYLGQVTVHAGGRTECFECQPKPVPKTHAICTIRNTPDKPVHCVEWAKAHLLPLLFGPPEGGGDMDRGSEPLRRGEGEGAGEFAARVFRRVFGSDVAELAAVEEMWAARRPPVPLDLDAILPGNAVPGAPRGAAGAALSLADHHVVWDAAQNAAVFLESTRRFLEDRAGEVGSVVFDKDDDLAVEFVTAAANLRSLCYGIPCQSLFDAKGMAGNIIHAIATTNAIISGLIVVEALKLLAAGADGDLVACRATFLRQDLSNRRLLTPVACQPPNPECCVCGTAQLTLRIDTRATTLGEMLDLVLHEHLGLGELTLETILGAFMYEEGEGLEADEVAKNQAHLRKALTDLPGGGIVHGSLLDVRDQAVVLRILVAHQAEWNEEQHPLRFALEGSMPAPKEGAGAQAAEGAKADGAAAVASTAAVVEDDDEVLEIVEDETDARDAAAKGKRKRKASGETEVVVARKGKRARAADGSGAALESDEVVEILDD